MNDVMRRLGWKLGRGLFAALFIMGGIGHFAIPETYRKIMPPSLPQPLLLIYLSGIAEFGLGALLLWSRTQSLAAWGLIALLIAVFPANLFMWQHAEQFSIRPIWLLIRLPLQGLLIAWAWAYTRPVRLGSRGAVILTVVVSLIIGPMVGCGRPSLPRLDRGALVRTESLTNEPIVVFFAASQETVEPGTIVKVVSDEEGTTGQVARKVIVGFQDGPHQGLAGLIRRNDLQLNR